MVELLSKGANWYFEFQETVAVVVGVSGFILKWWRSRSSPSVIEAAVAAILIPSGLGFVIAAFDPGDLLPMLHDAYIALVVGGCALIYLGVSGALK